MKVNSIILILLLVLGPSTSFAGSGKEFTTSVIYGTLAGTLVGAATLAFTSNPGDNLNNVARGASYGLYAGILLGLYIVYGLDTDEEVEQQPEPQKGPEPEIYQGNPVPAPPEPEKPQGSLQQLKKGFAVYPLFPLASDVKTSWGVGVRLIDYHF